ncbi:unnamed protein product [Alopecurus aequalis]
MPSSGKTVCVVGAGLSGLVSARELLREGHEVTVIELANGVGGQWLYDDGHGMQSSSSVYASLRLISPREAMGFSDFPFHAEVSGGGDTRRYPGHREFIRYIRDFCDAFGLMDAVRLNTRVVHISREPAPHDGCWPRWVVRSTRDGVVTEETFDAVVVASGNRSQPRLPAIDGMDTWRRRHLHCHSYRVPDPFRDEVVVIVGCKESGKDIGLELRKVAKESAGQPRQPAPPPADRPAAADGRVVFADGLCVDADTVIYCTGYTYSFPFLETEGQVTVDDNRARWVAQVLSGRRMLPPEEEMLRSTDEYNRARELAGVPKQRTHDILDLEYCDEYGEKHCGFPRLEEWKKELAWSSMTNNGDNLDTFRDDFRDSELVREGLRQNGWLPLVLSEERKEDEHAESMATTAPPLN